MILGGQLSKGLSILFRVPIVMILIPGRANMNVFDMTMFYPQSPDFDTTPGSSKINCHFVSTSVATSDNLWNKLTRNIIPSAKSLQ